MRVFLVAAVLAAASVPAFADETSGEILAFDRKAGVIVMMDKTVWSLELLAKQPVDLQAGDKVKIVFEAAGEDGITLIDSVTKL